MSTPNQKNLDYTECPCGPAHQGTSSNNRMDNELSSIVPNTLSSVYSKPELARLHDIPVWTCTPEQQL